MARGRVFLPTGTSRGLVLDLVRTQGPISRTDLVRITGLTPATMSAIVRQLLDEGLIRESGAGPPSGGRPTVMLEVDTSARYAVGVHLGDESITYVVVNLRGGIVGRLRTPVAGPSGPGEMVALVSAQIERTLTDLGIDRERVVGIGAVAPGPVDIRGGRMFRHSALAGSQQVPVRQLLSDATSLPVVLDNDATGAALGDFWTGDTEGAHAHATVYMGTGISAGILIDGTVYRGASSNAGDLGYVVVSGPDAKPAHVEQLAAPAAVVRAAHEHPEEARRLRLTGSDFAQFTILAQASVRGDAFATGLLEESANRLALATSVLANLFDLDSITLAGPAFISAGALYLRAVERRVGSELFARDSHGIRVRLSTHVADAAAVGAAALVLQSELAPRAMGLVASGD